MPTTTKYRNSPGPGIRIGAVLTGLVAALGCRCASADWDIGATAGAFYDNNLTRAQNAADKRAAGAATANVSANNFIPLTGSDSVALTLYGRAELFDRYHGLTNVGAGAIAVYRRKFGVGYAVPWVSLAVGGSYDSYRDDLRSGARLDVRAEAGMRFTEQLDASAGLYYEHRYDGHGQPVVPGISGNVFDLAGQGGFLRAGYDLTNDLNFDARAGVRRGDVESTSQPSLPIFLASSAIAADPVWGDPNLYAYRLRGTTWSGDLTTSYALSDKSSLNLAYRYAVTHAAQGLEYSTSAIFLTFDHRF
jgi:hypothetical protein